MSNSFIARNYNMLSNKEYSQRRSYYKRKAFQENERFEEYLYNAVGRAIEHADPSHLADAVQAARDLQKYRSIYRVLSGMSLPWHWSDIETPKGDVPKANKKRLAMLRINWQTEFSNMMDKEEVHQETKPVWDWAKKQAVLLKLVKQAKEHGIDMEEVMETIKKAA